MLILLYNSETRLHWAGLYYAITAGQNQGKSILFLILTKKPIAIS